MCSFSDRNSGTNLPIYYGSGHRIIFHVSRLRISFLPISGSIAPIARCIFWSKVDQYRCDCCVNVVYFHDDRKSSWNWIILIQSFSEHKYQQAFSHAWNHIRIEKSMFILAYDSYYKYFILFKCTWEKNKLNWYSINLCHLAIFSVEKTVFFFSPTFIHCVWPPLAFRITFQWHIFGERHLAAGNISISIYMISSAKKETATTKNTNIQLTTVIYKWFSIGRPTVFFLSSICVSSLSKGAVQIQVCSIQ